MTRLLDETALRAMTRRECIDHLTQWHRYQLDEFRKRLEIKACRCKTNTDIVMLIVSHLHPVKRVSGGNTFEQKSLF